MKSLIAGIVVILLLGTAGFFYRNVQERTAVPPVACTMEAKICPDGSAVGRTGPSCQFAACPPVSAGAARFVVPEGYAKDERLSMDPSLVASFVKPSMSSSVSHAITIREYPIPEGETADDVILANTRYQPADMPAEDFERFETVIIGGKTFRSTVIERFEALIQSAYFLALADRVLRFDIVEHDVVDWMEPTLDTKNLPEHAAFLQMLGTIETN